MLQQKTHKDIVQVCVYVLSVGPNDLTEHANCLQSFNFLSNLNFLLTSQRFDSFRNYQEIVGTSVKASKLQGTFSS